MGDEVEASLTFEKFVSFATSQNTAQPPTLCAKFVETPTITHSFVFLSKLYCSTFLSEKLPTSG
jgi:hypothetical protein